MIPVDHVDAAPPPSAADKGWEQTIKRWGRRQLSRKLLHLRVARGWTRRAAAQAAGIPESALRNYELMSSAPREDHLEGLAAAFGVRVEALHCYDFRDSDLLAQAFFQFSAIYGLEPVATGCISELRPTSPFMRAFLGEWAARHVLVDGGGPRADYEMWMDNFAMDFDPSQFPLRYEFDPRRSWVPIAPWQNRMQARKLPELRKRCRPAKTQADLAGDAGVSLAALRSYEQGSRVPRRPALQKLADALEVSRGALVFTDFGSPVQAAHALFQLAGSCGLIPARSGAGPALIATEPTSHSFISEWSIRYGDRIERAEEYDRWVDRCDYLAYGRTR